MASPAEVANDMAAHARYWDGRDREVASTCRQAANLIRAFLNGDRVDGRSYHGLHKRLLRLDLRENTQGYPNFQRARLTLEELRRRANGA